jgi:hypothetical protein
MDEVFGDQYILECFNALRTECYMTSLNQHLGDEAHSAIGTHSALHTAQYGKNLDLIFVCIDSIASERSL